MSIYKKKLITLIAIEAVLILVSKIYEWKFLGDDVSDFLFQWNYYVPLLFGIAVIFYAFQIKCHSCGKRQVFRGLSIFDLRWPDNNCFNCGNSLNKENKS